MTAHSPLIQALIFRILPTVKRVKSLSNTQPLTTAVPQTPPVHQRTVTVIVTGTNDQPVASDISINAAEDGNSITTSFSQTDADSSDTHTFSITSPPAEGSVTNNNDGTLTFNPGSDFQDLADGETRQVSFQYTATDNSGSSNSTSAPATVTVIVTGKAEEQTAPKEVIIFTEDFESAESWNDNWVQDSQRDWFPP